MRPLEILMAAAVAAAIAWHLTRRRGTLGHRGVAASALVVSGGQLMLEGYRWQLVPGYVAAAFLVVLAWRPVRPVQRDRWWLAGWITVAVLVVFLPWLVPVPSLPEPDGAYAVGTTTVVLVDESRIEMYGPHPGGPRTFPVHVWYPAEGTGDPAPGWLDRATAGAVAHQFGLPGFFLDHLTLTSTYAVVDAPVRAGENRFPVVLYSHGWTGFGRISPDQPERLASHGYVVIAPDHTYGALVADLPGGREPLDPDALPDEETVSEDAYDRASRALVATYADDLRFVLDALPTLDAGLGLTAHLDLERVGIFGHSTGGGAAVAACWSDPRCDAVLGFDPWVEPVPEEAIASGLVQPFLAIRSEPWLELPNDPVLQSLHAAGGAPSILATLLGADHYDFVSLSQISPLAGVLGFKGPIPGPRAQEILDSELIWFFDLYLKGVGEPQPRFPEVRIDVSRG